MIRREVGDVKEARMEMFEKWRRDQARTPGRLQLSGIVGPRTRTVSIFGKTVRLFHRSLALTTVNPDNKFTTSLPQSTL